MRRINEFLLKGELNSEQVRRDRNQGKLEADNTGR